MFAAEADRSRQGSLKNRPSAVCRFSMANLGETSKKLPVPTAARRAQPAKSPTKMSDILSLPRFAAASRS